LAIAGQAKERRVRNVELLAGYGEATANAGLRDGVFPALGRTLPLRLAQPAQESELHEMRHRHEKEKCEIAQRRPAHLRYGQLPCRWVEARPLGKSQPCASSIQLHSFHLML
jgi:hypothetical protein